MENTLSGLITPDSHTPVSVSTTTSQATFLPDGCVHELFEAQVERTPASVALIYEDQQLTYRELNERANRLARHLREMGVAPEVMVGLCMERSIEMVVGLLGILKAGGAYLPLDPTYPLERLRFMVEDARVAVILKDQQTASSVRGEGVKELDVSLEREAINKHDSANLKSAVDAEGLGYVIYTSGSTGRPKGVMVRHRGICNLALAQIQGFHMRADDVVLQFASISFDASVSEIFKTFLCGATLCLTPRNSSMAGPDLARLLRQHKITAVTLPPTVLATLPDEEFPLLRKIIVAGETCPAHLMARWARAREFFNAYGPTENTVCATIEQYDETISNLSIGWPISNVEVYILDEQLQPAGTGVAGQLYVGGEGVARGYLGRPALTAERFIPHPFSHASGQRLYATGDVCRQLDDGRIEFLGRSDEQVKVRGFRIELGEVEAAINEQAGVRECVVVAREQEGGEKRLVAYVVATGEEPLKATELREHVKGRLPEYMVPGVFVELEALPLTANGKIDKAALPEPGQPGLGEAYVEAETKTEEMIAGLWREVLGVERVGMHDNFFALGGDSIRAALLLNKLQEATGEVVYVVALFDAPTVRGLAQYLRTHYPQTVARLEGVDYNPEASAADTIGAADVARLRSLIRVLPARPDGYVSNVAKNPPAVFVLSPPRSGSTLLRVMLAGHPGLFAPPELQLLGFDSLAERAEVFSGRYAFWQEGVVRAVMESLGEGAEEARERMRGYEASGMSVREFYGIMQGWIGDRLLVDKTPSYALEAGALERAEEYFEGARYIHLLRHPQGMIRSFLDAKLDQIFRYEHPFTTRQLAELIWLVCHEYIVKFLSGVPAERQHRVQFEELVREPERELRRLCDFLGLEYEPGMAQPHQDKEKRMTDGIHGMSRMLGDIKFHTHDRVDAGVAERWKKAGGGELLSELTWSLAASLGYHRDAQSEATRDDAGAATQRKAPPSIKPLPRRGRGAGQ